MEQREYRYTEAYRKRVWMGALELPLLEEDVLEGVVDTEVLEDPLTWSLEGLRDVDWWPEFIEEDSL
ncbi:MAG TPA: hypothetical protein PK364_00265 [Synergistaceae bacterium]|nr:hypothetical protein [Synergistaceae bacterium]HPJ25230.1 hypothetical protein [Synergistaceae bacterium]HPQ36101.1 hypothetical protein [Synergistaceae bacterium]